MKRRGRVSTKAAGRVGAQRSTRWADSFGRFPWLGGAYRLLARGSGRSGSVWSWGLHGLEVSADMTVYEARVVTEPVSGCCNNAFTCSFALQNLCEWSSISKQVSLTRLTA
jgi:hypothetical protein